MKTAKTALALLVLGVLGLVRAQDARPTPPTAGGASASKPRFHVVRALAGSRAHQDGSRYVVEDPRTAFYLPEDKQVIVYFEWDGPKGTHHIEGQWKNPDGKIVSLADFPYEAKTTRFAAYWTFTLTEQMAAGLWVLDARIDGESAGSHTVQLVVAPKPPGAEAPAARHALSPGEIYARATLATVNVENLGAKKERRGLASGFVLDGDQVITSFEAIEGAASLAVVMSDGKRFTTDRVLSWGRRQGWAVLLVPGVVGTGLARAAPDAWQVGDRCYGLDVGPDGSRTIATGTIVGKRNDATTGERIHTSLSLSDDATGAPILDELGDVVAVAAGELLPGSGTLHGFAGARSLYALRLSASSSGIAIPLSKVSVPPTGGPGTPLAELQRNGEFLPPITAGDLVLAGSMAKSLTRTGSFPQLGDEQFEFSRREGKLFAQIEWGAAARVRGQVAVQIFDIDNKLRGESKPERMNLRGMVASYSLLEHDIARWSPGLYRMDVLFDGQPAWRAFFRVID